MGTDRSEIYSGPCLCGKGEIIINFCTPDHPWPTQSNWFETDISCKSCSKEFVLIEQGQHFVAVKRSDYDRCQQYMEEYHKESKELMKSQEVIALASDLRELLESQKSIAACHRLLRSHGLDYYSIGTFRKHWLGAAEWVRHNITTSNLKNVMKALNASNSVISNKLEMIEELYKKHKEPLPVVGQPLINVSRYGV